MKAIISRQDSAGRIVEVGTNNRILVTRFKTTNGVMRYANEYAGGLPHRVEFFHDHAIYKTPFKSVEVR